MYQKDEVRIEDTIDDMTASRKIICTKLDELEKLVREINQEYMKHSEFGLDIGEAISRHNAHFDKEKLRKEIDVKFWKTCLDISQVEKFVSSKEKQDMREKISENPPIFDAENAKKFIYGVMNSTDALATNLIKKIYSELTNLSFRKGNNYRTVREKRNQNKVEKSFRATIFWGGLPSYVRHHDSGVAVLEDLERVCCLIDGKTQPDSRNNITTMIENALRAKERAVDNDYFSVTFFLNGNVKISFHSQAVVDKINLWGAKHNELPNFSGMFK